MVKVTCLSLGAYVYIVCLGAGRPPGPEFENNQDRECYSLAAGLALGLVMLAVSEILASYGVVVSTKTCIIMGDLHMWTKICIVLGDLHILFMYLFLTYKYNVYSSCES